MKKLVCIMLSVLMLLLCGCGTDADPLIKQELDNAVSAVNAETKLQCGYMLEITFGDQTVLYYAIGDAMWDRKAKTANAFFDQTYLGNSVVMENYFADGKMVTVENGEALAVKRDGDVLLSKFPYFMPETAVDGMEIIVGANSQGKTYTFVHQDTKALCESILGGDIYALVTAIKKPQKDKTVYGEGKCIYTVSGENLVSCRYEFDVKLFDTPAVTATYTPPESEYTLDLHITAKISYTHFGDKVEIQKYSTPDEE